MCVCVCVCVCVSFVFSLPVGEMQKNMSSTRDSFRGFVLKSTPTQPKESTYEGMAWNDSVEAALDQGMESISAENHFLSDPPPYLLSHPVISSTLVTA